ncbi:single-stranded DNA-binding protein [Corynebacterium bovis]|uniref:Single-strand DNA-binding protein n=1 Tax=Corynebacterium bovis DSM 20582 = CIP 54.80 TaxID=927655 RepID=A0A8I0CJW4_9CORY|nr:single-stranded DNA-binding protein [Corynebacterium bovis]MBB3114837.1 single-strand DNA-binding protein [Corynebacterium bovis DSM 20582 = CIP 54.80]QQC48151.1 single-stranded DNA-binding protein [Corynebacterium bovis]RRO81086.1 single-stranded DNA-binding protein [Corynebacterium bovis]RRO83166.1 single-stranded DNA-binding protein [Corynebacterium bovis]RRO84360.1 single-stranded DNA-binding protein [Corynebacterium bovis]
MSLNIASVVLAGNVVGNPERRKGTFDLVTFRMASDRRWFDGTEWQQGDTVYIDVQCWGQLGRNVLTSVSKGMAFIVVGRLIMSRWQEELPDGTTRQRQAIRLKATHCGPDLNRVEVTAVRPRRSDDDRYGMTEDERRREAERIARRNADSDATDATGGPGGPADGGTGATGGAVGTASGSSTPDGEPGSTATSGATTAREVAGVGAAAPPF